MDEAVLALLGTFAEIERELGRDAFEAVVERARVAVAHEVLVEAERRALKARRRAEPPITGDGIVIPFPSSASGGHP